MAFAFPVIVSSFHKKVAMIGIIHSPFLVSPTVFTIHLFVFGMGFNTIHEQHINSKNYKLTTATDVRCGMRGREREREKKSERETERDKERGKDRIQKNGLHQQQQIAINGLIKMQSCCLLLFDCSCFMLCKCFSSVYYYNLLEIGSIFASFFVAVR